MEVRRGVRTSSESVVRLSDFLVPLITISLSELRQDFRQLLQSDWDEIPQRRAQVLLSTLAEVCERHRMDRLRMLIRSLACLARLSRPEAVPLLAALRKKLE